MQVLVALVSCSGVLAAVITYSVRNARKPAPAPDLAEQWKQGGPV